MLLEHVLGLDRTRLLTEAERPVAAADLARLRELLARRRGREPMAQILGRREFWSLDFIVTGDTLTPRPDSETVIAAALAWLDRERMSAPRVLDLGTGTGCLLLALLHECAEATGLGLDISAAAIAVAEENAARLGLANRAEFRRADWNDDWMDGRDAPFDLILANPPYIPAGEIDGLQPEVARYEPRVALDGGTDGLDAYRDLTGNMARWLRPGGAALLEIGQGQDTKVGALASTADLAVTAVERDLAGIARCVVLRRPRG